MRPPEKSKRRSTSRTYRSLQRLLAHEPAHCVRFQNANRYPDKGQQGCGFREPIEKRGNGYSNSSAIENVLPGVHKSIVRHECSLLSKIV
jgi:hypothetical protein